MSDIKSILHKVKERLWLKMELPLILTAIIAAFIWTQRQKTDVWDDAYSDFNEMLREASEMCDAAIESVLHIVSHETNQKLKSLDVLKKLFDIDQRSLDASRTISESGTCEARSWKDGEKTWFANNPEECLEMIEIEQHLEGIFEDMVQSGKEISTIKEEFPDIVEANCAGEENEGTCKLQLFLSAKSHVADLLSQASVNVKIINEIMSVYRRIALICLENI